MLVAVEVSNGIVDERVDLALVGAGSPARGVDDTCELGDPDGLLIGVPLREEESQLHILVYGEVVEMGERT
jgi:hypothetical protein